MSRRDTYTPHSTPQTLGNCGHGLKVPMGKNRVRGLKTLLNNPDEALTEQKCSGQDLRVPVVYVLNLRGQPVMPTTPRKARVLLSRGKAKVKKRTPFTIQLLYPTGEASQLITLGVDSGYKNVGLSAVSEKKELYCTEVELRTDIIDLLSERKHYRRTRRGRKTWYRQPRFLNRSKPKSWLAPSVQHRLDSHVMLVEKVKKLLPITNVIIEVATFNIQKIQNPEIQGEQYQEGPQKDFYNIREYVLYRDNHCCQHCKGKSKDKVLNVHHLESRKTGGNRPENLITLCKYCHDLYHAGNIKLKQHKPDKSFRAETFMSMIKWKIVELLNCGSCYGYETKYKRSQLLLPKTHGNDAFVIAGGEQQTRSQQYNIKKVRKQNRKLFKGPHSGVKNTAPRFVLGFQRYDKVLYQGQECFVFGRRVRGTFNLRLLTGETIHTDAKVIECRLLESARTWLTSFSKGSS